MNQDNANLVGDDGLGALTLNKTLHFAWIPMGLLEFFCELGN